MSKRLLALIALTSAAFAAGPALANPDAEALVKRVANEVIDAAKADKAIQAGDVSKVIALVDAKVMPQVNFEVMTRSAVGPQWRSATPEQKTKLQAEFKTLLARVFSGALRADQGADGRDHQVAAGAVEHAGGRAVRSARQGRPDQARLPHGPWRQRVEDHRRERRRR